MFVAGGRSGVDDDSGKTRCVEPAIIEVEGPAFVLLCEEVALESVCGTHDDGGKVFCEVVEVLTQGDEFVVGGNVFYGDGLVVFAGVDGVLFPKFLMEVGMFLEGGVEIVVV